MKRSTQFTRRRFMQLAGVGMAALALPTRGWTVEGMTGPLRKGKLVDADKKMNIASIGCGGKGASDIGGVATENIIGLCDVDDSKTEAMAKKFPNAKKYKDYRVMLKELGDQIDGVTVSTPDHTHFPAAALAIAMGKHVYVQKPLTHTIWEARELLRLSREHEVVTQMGNQGHAGEGIRLVKEWFDGGVLGDIKEVHVYTNRPIWPQGMGGYPEGSDPVPSGVDWNLWQGVAPERPYKAGYMPFKWRGWWDYGCGAMGDMGCHTMDAACWTLGLTAPESIEAESGGNSEAACPRWATVILKFPARGKLPPCTLYWHEGTRDDKKQNLPERPKELEADRKFQGSGQILYGSKATVFDAGDYCNSPRIIPEAKFTELKSNLPAKTLPRVIDANGKYKGDPFQEWIRACKGGAKAGSNFEYAVGLTELCLLGNLGIRMGKKLEWDSKAMKCTNNAEADRYINKKYRQF